jgi:glycosyltransferase involved in cell wall biosynthesis
MPAFSGGGSARVMLELATGFSDAGHDVELVVTRARGELVDSVPKNVKLVDLGARRIATALPALVTYLRQERPDVVLSALAPANCIAVWARALSRVPFRLVLSEHSTLSLATAGATTYRARFLPALMRRAYPKADGVVAVSGGVADDLARTIGLSREQIKVIYNPVVTPRLETMSREPVHHPWLQPGQPPVILGVGRLTPPKDFPTLIRAFARLREQHDARLMILGEGEERGNLEELVTELGLEADVALPGFASNPYAYMRATNLFVLSSRWEGLGNVLVEAMACGMPVVSTNCPSGPAEILEHGRWGELVPVGNPEALGEAISRTLARGLKGVNGRTCRPQSFTVEDAVDRYLKVLFGGGYGCD